MKVLYSYVDKYGTKFEIREALPEGHSCWLILPEKHGGTTMQSGFPLDKILELVEENNQLQGIIKKLMGNKK